MDIPDGRLRSERLNIKFNQFTVTSNEPQRGKLYNIATLA